MDILLKDLTTENLSEIIKIHINSFPDFFLTKLGKDFLRTYYKSCLNSDKVIAVGIFKKNILIGFAIGTVKSKGFHKELIKQNFYKFIFSLFKFIFLNPKYFVRLLKNLEKKKHKLDDGNYGELLSIAISENYSGLGYGGKLLVHFENKIRTKEVTILTLTTDVVDNTNTINFYKKNNFKIFYKFETYPKRKMIKFIKHYENTI